MSGKPRFSNRREFFWPKLNSHFYVGTAGTLTFGRGQTINSLHCSEFAFWPKPEEALVALTEAVPATGRIVIESTANGIGNYFHDLWRGAEEGENGFRQHSYVWWEDKRYALSGPPLADLSVKEKELMKRWELGEDRICWRRAKQRELGERFKQE